MAVFVSALPLSKRTQVGVAAGTASVQWSSNGNTINNIRNYHIRADGMIMESGRASGSGGWINNALGFRAKPDGAMTATLVQLGDGQGDVEIRLFYQQKDSIGNDANRKPMFPMISLFYKPFTGWQLDNGFKTNVGYIGYPASAVTWKDTSGVQQYRLYWISWGRTAYTNWALVALDVIALLRKAPSADWMQETGKGTIYEVTLSGSDSHWTVGNGGYPVASATSGEFNGGVSAAAVQWRNGERISVFYTDAVSLSWERPYEVKEVRWIQGSGWVVQPRPNDGWKDFTLDNALSAVSYRNPANGDWTVDLFIKWDNQCIFCTSKRGMRMLQFRSGNSGWSGPSEMATAAVDTNLYDYEVYPFSTVAWYYGGQMNQRMYYARRQAKCCGSGYQNTNMREASRTGNGAWEFSTDLDYQ